MTRNEKFQICMLVMCIPFIIFVVWFLYSLLLDLGF
jgi:hypothetical protein